MKKTNVLMLASLSLVLARSAHAQINASSLANSDTTTSSAPTASAQDNDPLDTDRPDFTNSPTTISAGRIQIEAGMTFTRTGNTSETTLGETLVRIGEGNNAELRIGIPNYVIMREGNKRTTGLDDAYLGTKLVLSKNEKLPFSLLLGTTLPTGSRDIGEPHYQPDAVLATDIGLAKKLSVGINLGVADACSNGTSFAQVFGSASFDYDLSEKVGAYAEIYGFNRTQANGSTQTYIDSGLTYKLNPNLQLDAEVGFGINNHVDGSDYFYGAGVTKRY